jgi:hypothetical protein
MAAKKSSTKSARTGVKNAGKPIDEDNARTRSKAARGERPSAADLDLRDRLKAGPRRPAGPPLVGDIMTKATMDALRDEVVPKATDPKNRKART